MRLYGATSRSLGIIPSTVGSWSGGGGDDLIGFVF